MFGRPRWQTVLFSLVTFLVPGVLLLTAVRFLLTPLYLQMAYRLPGFPEDPYGFSFEERLHWAEKSRAYLMEPVDIDYLGSLRFSDGRPLFNQRELRHMVDVKRVTQGALWAWRLSLAVLLLVGVWAWRTGQGKRYALALRHGAWLTLAGMGVLALFTLVAFSGLFVAFHNLFFEPGTWTFHPSDTLIRLFPLRFWQQAFLFAALLTAGMAGLLLWATPHAALGAGRGSR